jgi:hypothetical protein
MEDLDGYWPNWLANVVAVVAVVATAVAVVAVVAATGGAAAAVAGAIISTGFSASATTVGMAVADSYRRLNCIDGCGTQKSPSYLT